jgi:uncharacterized membrane protein YvbJ
VKKTPRFFCDNCNYEVEKNAKACQQCGRFFASVRCPACGFTGEEKLFSAGCPSCGYSTTVNQSRSNKPPPKPQPSGSFSPWLYFYSIIALLIVTIIFLYFTSR